MIRDLYKIIAVSERDKMYNSDRFFADEKNIKQFIVF